MTEIGPMLREARMRAGLDITEVERATKIRTKYLRAMEDEEWEQLPGPTFVKSFLRTYAAYLGLDGRLLVEEFRRRYERPAEGDAGSFAPPRSPGPGRTSRLGGISGPRRELLAVLAVIVVVVGGLYALGKFGGGDDGGSASVSSTSTQKKSKKKKGKGHRRAAPAQQARLQLVPTGTTYVCLVDGDGKKLLPGVTLSTSTGPRSFTAKRFALTLGNAGVKVKVNGRAVAVQPSAQAISLAITARAQRPLPAGRGPNCAA